MHLWQATYLYKDKWKAEWVERVAYVATEGDSIRDVTRTIMAMYPKYNEPYIDVQKATMMGQVHVEKTVEYGRIINENID